MYASGSWFGGFISAILHGAGDVFSGAESYIKQVRLPYLPYVFRFIWSKIIIFAHDFPIFVALMIYFGIWPTCFEPEILPMDEWLLAGDAHFMAKAQLRIQGFVERQRPDPGFAQSRFVQLLVHEGALARARTGQGTGAHQGSARRVQLGFLRAMACNLASSISTRPICRPSEK
jgi:hypothetical protein